MMATKVKCVMTLWRCTKCSATAQVIGIEVAHRCPNNKRAMTPFVVVK